MNKQDYRKESSGYFYASKHHSFNARGIHVLLPKNRNAENGVAFHMTPH